MKLSSVFRAGRWTKPVGQLVLLPVLMIVLVLGFYLARYRSVGRALSVLKDQGIYVLEKDKTVVIKENKSADVSFRIENISQVPIKILGVASPCTCTLVESPLPSTIGPGRSLDLHVEVTHGIKKALHQNLVVFTDYPNGTDQILRITLAQD